MAQQIKIEPTIERPKWTLIAKSEAAKKFRSLFALEPHRTYTVGRSRSSDIHLPTPLCSKIQCTLEVSDDEIIMKDQSSTGTRVNRTNYKNSRCILSAGDIIGFGCCAYTKHLNDKRDVKYFVYRLAIGADLNSCGTIILDSDDEEEEDAMNNTRFQADGNETDEDNQSADEMDVKPDIHKLMRMQQSSMQIKQEIEWNCYEYDRDQNTQIGEPIIENEDDPICISDTESNEDLITVEPPRKRIRTEHNFPTQEMEFSEEPSSSKDEQSESVSETSTIPEYQMSQIVRKEKCKMEVRSRGQRLATDMLMTKSNNANFKAESEFGSTIDQLRNAFITETTKWEYKWIEDRKPDALQFILDVKPLDINFYDLYSFQRQMKNLLLLEVFSMIYNEYVQNKSKKRTFSKVQEVDFDMNTQHHKYKCLAQNEECHMSSVNESDFAITMQNKGGHSKHLLTYVTQANRIVDGWEFDLVFDASQLDPDPKRKPPKCVQVAFVVNIQSMLESYISLYELSKSCLQEIYLRPCSQLEESDDYTDYSQVTDIDAGKYYEDVAVSLMGNSRILVVDGAAGSGKTTFIVELLQKFHSEQFQFCSSILVCGRNDGLTDLLAARSMKKIQNIVRFGKISSMRKDIQSIGVDVWHSSKLKNAKIVFIPLNNAVELLRANRDFQLCIVDDASLSSEAELLPLFRLKLMTLLLVGDQKLQTSATLNECCRQNGYSRSLFSRVIASYTQFDRSRVPYPIRYKQLRMDPQIAAWPNKYFYDNKMHVAAHSRVRRSPFNPYTVFQLNHIDDIESDVIIKLLQFCVRQMPPKRCSYGIICGHPDSTTELEDKIKKSKEFAGVEVSGYDSFQGREKDVIIMTALKPANGFELFSTKESLTIAVTRARETLIVLGNFQLVCSEDAMIDIDPMKNTYLNMIQDAKQRKRFFDLNGTYDKTIIENALLYKK